MGQMIPDPATEVTRKPRRPSPFCEGRVGPSVAGGLLVGEGAAGREEDGGLGVGVLRVVGAEIHRERGRGAARDGTFTQT